MNKNLHNSVLYIDMCQLRRNAEAILQELDGAQLIPVLKGNAYGLGQEEVGAALAAIPEIRTMAVAQVSEGAALRRAGVTQDILVLGGVPVRLLAPAVELGLTLTVGRPGLLPLLAELGHPPQIGLELLLCAVDDEVTLLGGDGHGNWLSSQEVSLLIGEDEGCGLTSRLSGRVGRVYL